MTALLTWMGSMESGDGRGSGVCEVWYMGGGVGETIGTCSRGGGEGNIKQYID